jgi:DNA repair exonuclease SbcCD ATPase subunit
MVMQHKGAGGSGGHAADELVDELYATPPPDFVSRREELAAEAKAEGRMEDALLIHAARRPTLAAWAANMLLRSQPVASQRFLELGRALREAYRTLDVEGIKELSDQRRNIVSTLSRQAAALAREAGHPLSDAAQQDVASTLHAVLADQDAADRWATGRLQSALTPPVDFPSTAATAATAATGGASRKPVRAPTAPRSSPTRAKDELAQRRRQRQEQLAQARKVAKAADQRLRKQRAAQDDADASMEQARGRHDQARQQVSAAEEQLRRAREEFQEAEQEQQAAEERCLAAADAVARAERALRDASQEVERLAAPVR